MKKKNFMAILTVICLLCFSFGVGCQGATDAVTSIMGGGAASKLSAPSNLRIDGEYLKWNPVEHATRYIVSVDGAEEYCNDYQFSIAGIPDGEHSFCVKACGDDILYKSSDFSTPLTKTWVEGATSSSGYYSQFDDLTKQESFLGYGFDVVESSSFSDQFVKLSFPIFQRDKLMEQRLVKVDSKKSTVEEIQSDSIDNFMEEWNAALKVDVKSGGKRIGGSVNIKSKYSGGSSTAKSKYYHAINIKNQQFYIVMQSDLETYRSIVNESFKKDLLSDMSPSVFFDKYGTHFITSAVMGGQITSYYLYTSESKKSFHDVSASVSTQVRYLVGKTDVKVEGGYQQKAEEQNISIINSLDVIGGGDFGMLSDADIATYYRDWEKSLNNHAALMGIKDSGSLIPVWELISDGDNAQERKSELEEYFLKYGLENYNELRLAAGVHEMVTPTDIENPKVNGKDAVNGEYEVYPGVENLITFDVLPENATGYNKSAAFTTATEYASINTENGLSIAVNSNAPHDTVLDVVLSAGGIRHQITVRVVRKYTVRFNPNGGEEVEPIRGVVHGSQIDKPIDPTKYGNLFRGWYKTADFSDEPFAFGSTPITDNITLYAKWEVINLKITFKNNIEGCADSYKSVTYNTACEKPDISEYYGYTFDNWYKDEQMTVQFDFSQILTADTIIYCKWLPNDYFVSFETNGGSAVDVQTVKYKQFATEPDIAKLGYEFGGWCKDEQCTILFDFEREAIESDTVLYAKWIANPVQITFEMNGGNILESIIIEAGESLGENMPNAIKAGSIFAGWYIDPDFVTAVTKDTVFLEDSCLYAKWENVEAISKTFNVSKSTHTVYSTGNNTSKRDWYDKLDLSQEYDIQKLTDAGYVGFKFEVSLKIGIKNDGYQHVYVYNNSAVNNSYLLTSKEYGYESGTHTPKFSFNAAFNKIPNGYLYFRYAASGWFAAWYSEGNHWYCSNVVVKVTPVLKF